MGGRKAFNINQTRHVWLAILMGAMFAVIITPLVEAQETTASDPASSASKFGDVDVKPLTGRYLVTSDLNVRARPATKGKRLTTLPKGTEVDAIGKAPGSWLAISLPDIDVGYVYQPALLPLQDGRLAQDLIGVIERADGRVCEYVIRFDGKTEVQGQAFQSADYEAVLSCVAATDTAPLVFTAPMFMTEGPFNGSRRPLFQIGIDLLELSQDYDRFFSTNLIYDRGKGEVRFDNVSVKAYATKPDPSRRPVERLTDALTSALTLAVHSWTATAWSDLTAALRDQKKVEVSTQ